METLPAAAFGSRANWRHISAHQVEDSSPLKNARRCPRRPATALPWLLSWREMKGCQPMPRKPADGQKLTRPVSFRLTDSDHAAYLAKVAASGSRPSEFFRECVLQNRTQIVARAPASSDKRRLLYLFNKTSNNMNQLAHAANVAELAGTATPATYAGILAELQAIADAMREVIERAD
ncbi:plasmid mobilization protein [Xanthomonas hortorum]|uniref:plasmid mobilization protein n=1 Tax=Xanthomonas hortorum TaxID=56454 RepID=UPI0032E92AB9